MFQFPFVMQMLQNIGHEYNTWKYHTNRYLCIVQISGGLEYQKKKKIKEEL